jgi:tripartite-type tricarboxylate transporter receptor subunit TctC
MKFTKTFFAALLVAGLSLSAFAAEWKPEQPIYIVGQSEAGSGPDMFVRSLQPYLQQEIGGSVVVENAPGSGGKIAATKVWNSEADGYTLLSHSSPLTTVTQITGKADFDIKSFEHIISFDLTPYCLIVKKDSPIKTLADFVETAKKQRLVNGNSGLGGAMYLQSMIMQKGLGIETAEVPFNGASPCMLAVMNGDITHSVLGYDTAINNQEEITILAIMADKRLDVLPNVPTMKELGYDFPELTMRRGIVAPKGTPKEAVDALVGAFDRAVKNPEFQKYIAQSGMSMDVVLGADYQAIDKEYYDVCMEFVDLLGGK